jgi:hypothetical protein
MSEINAAGLDRFLQTGLTKFDRVTLHSDAPGVDGTANVVSAAPVACAWDTPESDGGDGRQAPLAAAVEFTGATPTTTVAYIGVWDNNTGSPVYLGYITRSTGDAATNAAGAYTVTVDTTISVENAA